MPLFLLFQGKVSYVLEELKEKAGLVLIMDMALLVLRDFIADRQHLSVYCLEIDRPSFTVKANRP